MDSGEHTATLIRGQHATAQRSLTALESTQKTWDEVHDTMESISALGEIKQIGDTYSRYKATPGGVTDFLGQELGKTKAAGLAAGEAVVSKGAAVGSGVADAARQVGLVKGSFVTGGAAAAAAETTRAAAAAQSARQALGRSGAPGQAAAPAAETPPAGAAAPEAEDVEKTPPGVALYRE